MLKFITDNWDILSGLLAIAYELCVRLFPTEKNRSLIDLIFKFISVLVPNRATKPTYTNKQNELVEETKNHIVKMIIILMLCSLYSFAQNNVTGKSYRSYHADSLTVKTEALGLWLLYDTGKVGVIYYEPIQKKWRVLQDTLWYDLINTSHGSAVNFGTTEQIPYMNGTNNNFLYSSNFTFDGTNRNLLVGTTNSASGSTDQIIVGSSNTITGGGWGIIAGEQNTVTGGGGDLAMFGLRNTTNRGSTLTFGTDNSNLSAGSFVGGYDASVNATNNVPGFAFGLGAGAANKVTAVGGAFNISHNSALGAGLGALAQNGGILGGTDNYIVAGADNSVIIGGKNMSMLNADTSTVYVPNFRVRSYIGTGTRMVVTDATGHTSTQAIPTGTPAGSNTQIQFNNSGAFGASSNLTWSGTAVNVNGTNYATTNLVAAGNYTIVVPTVSSGTGNFLDLSAGSASSTGNGGDLFLEAGRVSGSGTPGTIQMIIQNDKLTYSVPTLGNIKILSSNSDTNTGSSIQLEAGTPTTGNNNGGNITIKSGTKSGTGTDGNITINALTGYLILSNIPTSSAGLPSGAVWSNAGVLTIVP